eukprot:UC4_evm6s1151
MAPMDMVVGLTLIIAAVTAAVAASSFSSAVAVGGGGGQGDDDDATNNDIITLSSSGGEGKTIAESVDVPPVTPGPRPPSFETARLARWLIANSNWGTIATISNGHDSHSINTPFANPQSFSDGIANSTNSSERSTGTPYFLMTLLDETPQDFKSHPIASFSVSEAQMLSSESCLKTDPEDPTCSRISFTGQFVDLTTNGTEEERDFAMRAFESKHPELMASRTKYGLPPDHDFQIYKLIIQEIFFLAEYGGAAKLSLTEYFDAKAPHHSPEHRVRSKNYRDPNKPPKTQGCFGHQKNSVQAYFLTVTDCDLGIEIFNKHLLNKNHSGFAGCWDHHSGIPYFSSDESCQQAVQIFNKMVLPERGQFSACIEGAQTTRFYPVFKDTAICEAARVDLDRFLEKNHNFKQSLPRNKIAFCPVTGKLLTINSTTPSIQFKNGQRIYFESTDSAATYRKSPREFWLSPSDLPLNGLDGATGLPDIRNETRRSMPLQWRVDDHWNGHIHSNA